MSRLSNSVVGGCTALVAVVLGWSTGAESVPMLTHWRAVQTADFRNQCARQQKTGLSRNSMCFGVY